MSARTWLRSLKARLIGATPGGRANSKRLIRRCRLETLEDRAVPAVINWDGGGDGSN